MKEENCGCGCGCGEERHDHECCGHEHHEGEMYVQPTVHLTLDDDTEVDCDVLGIFEVEGKEYIAVLPKGEEEVLLYGFKEEGEEIDLLNIESDEEFEKVAEAFEKEFEEMPEDEQE